LTLLYVAPRGIHLWEGERDLESVTHAEQQAQQYIIKGRKALERGKRELMKFGFEERQIETKLQARRHSKVVDIIQEGGEGLYDAVVFGRRGLSWLEEAFDESVSKGVLEKRVNFPMWICRRPDLRRKGLLVCVDGSKPSSRMVDHVGFMLAKERKQKVTLAMVKKRGQKSEENDEAIFNSAREHLTTPGFPADKIETKVLEGSNVAKSILKEANEGRYAAVAVGRTGGGQGLLGKIFMGSVSTALFRELEGAAVWISY